MPAAARTMALFEVFAREQRELTKSELARLLDLPESSCSDLLNTLYQLGYVSRSVETRRYYPTGRLVATAGAIAANDPLSLFGQEATALLGQMVGETCIFGMLDGDRVKIMSVWQGSHRLRYVVEIGDRVSLHGTAVGKALLGALHADERGRILRLQPLRRLTPDTITNVQTLEAEIVACAKRVYRSRGEGAPGVWSLAISGYIGERAVGLSMIGPADRVGADEERFVAALEKARLALFDETSRSIAVA